MKKEKKVCLLLLVCCLFLFSGCSRSSVSVTEEEQNMVAEYIAHLMLSYDKNYEATLVETISVPDEPATVDEEFSVIGENTADSGEADDKEDSETQEKYSELDEVFAEKDIQIVFTGYEEHEIYPEGEEEKYFPLVAPEGKKLAVMKFQITNMSSQEKTFSQLETSLKYRLDLDSKTYIKPNMTLLINDLQYINTMLAPGEEQEAVVVFAVEEEANLSGANLLVYSETKTAIEKLK